MVVCCCCLQIRTVLAECPAAVQCPAVALFQHATLSIVDAGAAEAALLFGRGLRAGVDRREQKKASANHEADLLRKARNC